MINLHSSILILLIISSFSVFSQTPKKVYLVPHLGAEWVLSGIEDKSLQPSYVTGTVPIQSDKYGLDVMVELSEKWSASLGYGWGNIGYGLHYKSVNDANSTSNQGLSLRHNQIRRLYVSVARDVTSIKLFRKRTCECEGAEVRHFFNFDMGIRSGIAYEHFPRFNHGGFSLVTNTPGVDRIVLTNDDPLENPVRWRGVGLFGEVYFQFYNKDHKRRLRVGLTYHQGIQKRMFTTWETGINGTHLPDFQTFTRGTMFALALSYPIKLFQYEQKE